MNDGLIPGRYAKALYKFANINGDAQEIYEELKRINISYSSIETLRKEMLNPHTPAQERTQRLMQAINTKGGGSLEKFILLVIKKNRIDYLGKIAFAYVQLYRQKHNIANVVITTATQLPSDKINEIIDVVKKELGDVTLEVVLNTDPNLIGGFTVRVDSILLDASVKNELQNMRLKLLS